MTTLFNNLTNPRSLRLAVQDAALSRRKHEFDSRRERHYFLPIIRINDD